MAQAKVITEQELKRALGMVAGRKHASGTGWRCC
jgi:hypothetical protein